MNCEELIESLWRKAEENIALIAQDANVDAERIKSDMHLKINHIREESQRLCSSEAEKRTHDVLAEAEKKAQTMCISGIRLLSDRLYRIACSALPLLRNQDYQRTFTDLASELPLLTWKKVRVNNDDVDAAHAHFPEAEVIADPEISGGIDAETEGRKIRIINTFNKRLERAWEEILPDLMKEDYGSL